MTTPIGQFVDTTTGRTSTNPFITMIMARAPTGNDGINNALMVGQRWIDTANGNGEYFLLNFIASQGTVQANWVQISGGLLSLETLTGNTGIATSVANNINVVGDGTTGGLFTGSGENLTLTLNAIPNSALANSSITLTAGTGISISTSPVSLGGSTIISATNAGDVTTLSDDVGTTITPSAGNIQLVGHIVEQGATKFSTVVAGTHLANINPMSSARWIVDPLGFNGTHTTIASAIASATNGDVILIMDGAYTENLILIPGVTLASIGIGNVVISGKVSYSGSGSVYLIGITFNTNGDYALSITGSSPSQVLMDNCYIRCLGGNVGLSNASSDSGSTFNLMSCNGDAGGTTSTLFVNSGIGSLSFQNCMFSNAFGTFTPSTSSGGGISIYGSTISFPISTSSNSGFVSQTSLFGMTITIGSSGGALFSNCRIDLGAGNANNCIITSGTGNTYISNSYLFTGTGVCVSVGSGTGVNAMNNAVSVSGTNVFSGAGTINTGSNTCFGSGTGNSVSTINHLTVI